MVIEPHQIRNVHIGNVAEFTRQFFSRPLRPEEIEDWESAGHHYGSMAILYTPDPSIVILPRQLDPTWAQLQQDALGWTNVEVISRSPVSGSLSEAIISSPELTKRFREPGYRLVPWGRSPEFARLTAHLDIDGRQQRGAEVSAEDMLKVTARYESKLGSHQLFKELFSRDPQCRVPFQYGAETLDEAARRVSDLLESTGAAVIKAEFGAGGYGTVVLRRPECSPGEQVLARLRSLDQDHSVLTTGSLVVQEFIRSDSPHKDITYDGYISPAGSVVEVGLGIMNVKRNYYIGVTVGQIGIRSAVRDYMTKISDEIGKSMAAAGYTGWFNVDYLLDDNGRVCPIEINARRSGPTIAHSMRQQLENRTGEVYSARTVDEVHLSVPLSEQELLTRMAAATAACRDQNISLVPTIVTASEQAAPYYGFAVGACCLGQLDVAESIVNAHVTEGRASKLAEFPERDC